jgi:hypothetical protein
MNVSKKYLIIFILLIITAIYYLPIIKSPLAPFDESVILVGADRIVKGQIPYKDFLTIYGPAQINILATLFKLFGVSVTVERIYDIIIKSFLSIIIFLIIRRLASNKTAIIGWVMSLIWIEYTYFHVYPVYPAALFTFISVYFLLFHMEQEKTSYVVLSAISIVIAILFRHDLGGLAALVIAIFLLLRKQISKQNSWSPLIYYVATGVITSVPVIVYFIIYSDIDAALNDLIYYPMSIPGQQGLPYPALSRWNLPFYVFPSVLLIGLLTFIMLIKQKKINTTAYGVLLISLVGIVFCNQLWGRSDISHLIPSSLAAILLSPILMHTLSKIISQSSRFYAFIFILFIIFFGITLSKPIEKKFQLLPRNYSISVINPDIKRAKYAFIAQDIKDAVSFIQRNTTIDEYIYVGVKNHDNLVMNDPIFYFLAERNCATKYHELSPGHVTTSKIQNEMVNELKNTNTSLVVLAPRYSNEPNISATDTKIDILDNYISSNFKLRKTFGIYEIWTRKTKN